MILLTICDFQPLQAANEIQTCLNGQGGLFYHIQISGKTVFCYAPGGKLSHKIFFTGSKMTFYNSDGSLAGYALQQGASTTVFYHANGSLAGRAIRQGNSTSYFTANGTLAGRVSLSGSQYICYRSNGSILATMKKSPTEQPSKTSASLDAVPFAAIALFAIL